MSHRPWRGRLRSPRPIRPGEAARRPGPSLQAGPRSFRTIALEARKRDVRTHERAGAARRFLAIREDQSRLADEDPALSADPPPLGGDRATPERPSENQIEGGRQKEPVADQRIAGVEGRI